MKLKYLPLFIFLLVFNSVIFYACKKDKGINDSQASHAFTIPTVSPVTGSVCGIVVDENNNVVSGATVTAAGNNYITDTKGFFNINNVQLDKYISTVTVNQPGYFKAIRSFSANGTRNYLTIKLIPKTLAGTINSTGAGFVALTNGTEISFQPNSLVTKSNGVAYTGTVNVYASYIDPTKNDFSAFVPGSTTGQDAENMYFLQSAGMIAVELESPSGEGLQIASGKTAAIKLPIPSSLVNKVPSTIDTWSLDDRGIWIKENTASRLGDFYQMEVSHFSFWNCDASTNCVYLTLHIHDQNGNALPNQNVQLITVSSSGVWGTGYAITDSLGNASGLVPADAEFEMNISSNPFDCTITLFSQHIGPFTSNSSLDMPVAINPLNNITVRGTANNCSNQPIQNGMAAITFGSYNTIYTNITNGNYTAVETFCNNPSVSVTAFDYETNAHESISNLVVNGSTLNVPLITACNISTQATYTLSILSWGGSYIGGVPLDGTNTVQLAVNVLTPGDYNIASYPAYGITFSASGNFPTPGTYNINLQGSGTPEGAADIGVYIKSADQDHAFFLNIAWPPNVTPAVVSLYEGQQCPNPVITGNYVAGTILNPSNSISLDVNVTSAGPYYIFTELLDSIYFSAAGTFNNTGVNTVVLTGKSTPKASGWFQYHMQQHNNPNAPLPGCTFLVQIQ